MSYYVNMSVVGGYLVRDINLLYTKEGFPVCNFMVALNEPGKKEASYITCVAWKDTAVNVQKYAKKGQEITVTGRLETSNWKDQKGTQHATTKIVVEKFCLGALPKTLEYLVKKPQLPKEIPSLKEK